MRRVARATAPAVVAVGVLTAMAWGQPPGSDGPRDKKGPPGAEKQGSLPGQPGASPSGGRAPDPERTFNFFSRGADTIDFGQLSPEQKAFVKGAFERMGLPAPPDSGVMTKSQFMAALTQAQVAKAAVQPGGDFGRPGVGPSPSGTGFGPQSEKADPQVEVWVKTLTDKMNDPHDAIRDSARAGLMAVGGPALPALRQLAAGNDAKAFTARRLVQQIEQNAGGPGRPPGFGGPPGDPRFGPMPPRGAPIRPMAGDPVAPGRPGADRDPAPGVHPPLARLLGELDLTEPQRGLIEKVVKGYSTKLREVLEKTRSGQLDRAELRDTIAKMAETATADLRRGLTPDQQRRFDQLVPPGRQLFPTPFGPAAGDATPRRPGADNPDPQRPRRPNPDPNP